MLATRPLLVVTLIAGPLLPVFFTCQGSARHSMRSPPVAPLRWYPQNYSARPPSRFRSGRFQQLADHHVGAGGGEVHARVLSAFGLRLSGSCRTAVSLRSSPLMAPNQTTVTTTALISHLGLRNTFAGIILTSGGVAFGTS